MLIIYTLISGIQDILFYVSKIHSPRTTKSGSISPTIFCLLCFLDRQAQFIDSLWAKPPSLVATGLASTKHWQARLAKCSPFPFLWSPNLAIPSPQRLRQLVHHQVVWWPWVSSRQALGWDVCAKLLAEWSWDVRLHLSVRKALKDTFLSSIQWRQWDEGRWYSLSHALWIAIWRERGLPPPLTQNFCFSCLRQLWLWEPWVFSNLYRYSYSKWL